MNAYLLMLKLFQERGIVIATLLCEDGTVAAQIQTASPEKAQIHLEEAAKKRGLSVVHYIGGEIGPGLRDALKRHQERLGYALTGFNKTKPPKVKTVLPRTRPS